MTQTHDKFYEMDDYLKLRNHKEAFTMFCETFLCTVVGYQKWENSKIIKRVSKIATVSDEAWALLMLEGSWGKWTHEINKAEK